MAAVETFESFVAALSSEDKAKLNDFLKEQRKQMFAARSEDARTRIAHEFIAEVREQIRQK